MPAILPFAEIIAVEELVINDLTFSDVSEIVIPETKLSVNKFWLVKASSSAKSVKSDVVISEEKFELENVKSVSNVALASVRACSAALWSAISLLLDITPVTTNLLIWLSKFALSVDEVNELARAEPSHNPAWVKLDKEPFTWTDPLEPFKFNKVVPLLRDQEASTLALSKAANVSGSNKSTWLSVILISLKDSNWASEKAFRATDKFSAESLKVTFALNSLEPFKSSKRRAWRTEISIGEVLSQK